MWRRNPWDLESIIIGGITAVLLLIVVAPVAMVVVVSFSSGGTLEFPPPGWGTKWYRQALNLVVGEEGLGQFGKSVLTSIVIALTTMSIDLLVGLPASYALVRHRFPGKLIVEQMISLPIVFPLVVLGVSLLVMTTRLGIDLGFWPIVAGHVISTFPFVVRNSVASLRGIGRTLEEAAQTLGSSRARTFVEITLPLIRPGIFAGMLFAFILSFNEFTVSYFLYTIDVFPFPLWLFQRGSTSIDPTIFALSSVVIAFDVCLIWILDRIVGGQGISL